jgi:hypothetical protein
MASRSEAEVIHLHGVKLRPLGRGVFIYGFSEEYRLYVVDGEGRTKLVIAKDEKPLSISGKEKDETRQNGLFAWIGTNERKLDDDAFPSHRPFFRRLMTDDAGRIYVAKSTSILEKDKPGQVDVFSKDGYYLYRTTWSTFPSAIKSGFYYEVRENKDTSEYQIVRFRIKNWNQMKNGL